VENFDDQGVKVSFGCEAVLGEGVGADVLDEVGAEADCFATAPLFQTSFLPDLTHVNFLP